QPGHVAWVRGGNDQDEPVGREVSRPVDQSLGEELTRRLRTGGRVDVGPCALLELRCERVRAREVETCAGCEPLEGARQRRSRVHRQPVLRAAAAGREERSQRARRERPHRSSITDVALTIAVAGAPGSRPSSSTASRVTTATTRNGPASSSTCARSPSALIWRTVPRKRLRAESSRVSPPRRRAISPAVTPPPPAPARPLRIRPAPSQRP